jgi:hypothetical protein
VAEGRSRCARPSTVGDPPVCPGPTCVCSPQSAGMKATADDGAYLPQRQRPCCPGHPLRLIRPELADMTTRHGQSTIKPPRAESAGPYAAFQFPSRTVSGAGSGPGARVSAAMRGGPIGALATRLALQHTVGGVCVWRRLLYGESGAGHGRFKRPVKVALCLTLVRGQAGRSFPRARSRASSRLSAMPWA